MRRTRGNSLVSIHFVCLLLLHGMAACRDAPEAAPAGVAPSSPTGVGAQGLYRFEVTLTPSRPATGAFFAATVRVTDLGTGLAVDGLSVTLDATMPGHGHGLLTRPEHLALGEGRYEVRGLKLHMHGAWRFEVIASRAGETDRRVWSWEQPP